MTKKAAGFVIYRIISKNIIEYLLLKASYPPYHWTPPKGHVDKHETDILVTALRETEEESGLKREQITIDDFNKVIHYEARGKQKEVTYFLGQVQSDIDIKLSNEHTDYVWAQLQKAVELIGFESTSKVMVNCEEYIKTKHNL